MRYNLRRVVWEITWKCNAKCMHCGSDCISEEKKNELTTAECLDLVADLKQLGTKVIFLSGGDPMCRNDFGVIASAIKYHGMDVSFISNALGLNEERIKLIKAIKPIAFGISIDAADEYMHDYIRGVNGCFNHLLEMIIKLKENNIRPSIVTTLHKLNYSQLPKIRDLLLLLGVRNWQIQYADFIGRMPKEAMITEAQYVGMCEFIYDMKKNYAKQIHVTGGDGAGYMNELSTKIRPVWYGCHAGMKMLGIESDGTVRGCLSQQMDKYVEGNIRERSIIDIWNDPNAFSYNRHFDCSSLGGYCKECVYATVCKGGCTRSATTHSECRCSNYCLYKFEQIGYSSDYQARTEFTKEEIAGLYNPIRELPTEFYQKYMP